MKKITVKSNRKIKINDSYEADSMETKLRKVMTGEQIEMQGKGLVYTDRKDGVLPETNIRTDRFQEAQNALDYVTGEKIARREASVKAKETSTSESTQGTAE